MANIRQDLNPGNVIYHTTVAPPHCQRHHSASATTVPAPPQCHHHSSTTTTQNSLKINYIILFAENCCPLTIFQSQSVAVEKVSFNFPILWLLLLRLIYFVLVFLERLCKVWNGWRSVNASSSAPPNFSLFLFLSLGMYSSPVWPDWAIYWTWCNFSKPVATFSLPKSYTFWGNFYRGVKIFKFL